MATRQKGGRLCKANPLGVMKVPALSTFASVTCAPEKGCCFSAAQSRAASAALVQPSERTQRVISRCNGIEARVLSLDTVAVTEANASTLGGSDGKVGDERAASGRGEVESSRIEWGSDEAGDGDAAAV